ncbi:MAG: ABC transporter permease [Actinomycetota bacterium]|nr:ABC transporter permease [Actinomycetota bacterium]
MRASVRWWGIPLFVAAVLAVHFGYIASIQLDPIEQPQLTFNHLWSAFVSHLALVGVSLLVVLLIAVPLGIFLTRPMARRLVGPVSWVAGLGLAIPSIGVIVFFAVVFQALGFLYAVIALVIYATLPVLANTIVGLQQVDPFVIESGRGMGMSKRQVFRQVEMPLAVPVVLAGVRTALILLVGTATLATFTDGGGLGDVINSGLTLGRTTILFTGSILAMVLALFVDWLGGIAEDYLRPSGLR